MFRRLYELEDGLTVTIDGAPVRAAAGDSVATVLLLEGGAYRLTAVKGEARAPYCMIGNCFDCLVEIDGVANRQGCLVEVRDGMAIRRQRGKIKVGP